MSGKTPRKRGRFWRGLGLATLLIVAGGGAWGVFTQKGRDTVATISKGAHLAYAVKQNPTLIFDEAGSDHVNILLIGRDVNWKPAKVYDPTTKTYRPFHVIDKDARARSDSMIILSLDKNKGTVRLVSLPRDAMVRLPANEYHVRRAKLNAAHAYGGPELLIKTLHDELGLTIQHHAVIKFDGFKKLIDQVGGIEINVEGALLRDKETGKLYRGNLKYDDNWGNLHQNLKPGMQTLDGKQAHDYVRFREDIEGDTGRMRRQQQVMRALAKKIMHAGLSQLPGLTKELRQQFESDMTDEQLASAAFFMHNLGDTAKIQPITLFGVYSTRGSLTLNRPKNEKLLAAIFGSTFNKENFLNRSPSTDEDEIGSANDTNPGAQEVLREAGLLKGKIDPKLAGNADDMSPQGRDNSSLVAANDTSSTRNEATTISSGSTTSEPPRDASTPISDGAPDNRVVIASTETTNGEATSGDANGDSQPVATPRRRHALRKDASRTDAAHTDALQADVAQSETTVHRRRVARRRTELSADSPIPRAE